MNIEGYVLAGGRSSRMGTPKAKIEIGGRTYLELAENALRDFGCVTVTVVGGSVLENFIPWLPDVELDPPVSGSIVGLYTALSAANTDWIAILAVDLPLVNDTFLKRLWDHRDADTDAVVPVQPDGRLQPLCGFYKVGPTLEAVRASIVNGKFSLHGILDRLTVRQVNYTDYADFPNAEHLLLNVNTPDDHALALKIAQGQL